MPPVDAAAFTALSATSALAKALNIPIQIHLAETQSEISQAMERHKMRPVALLESLNFWAPITIGAHGVWINDDEIAVLKKRHVGISHNPESNMTLASGIAPIPEYLAAGIAVAIAIVVFALGSTVNDLFGNTLTAILGG